MFHKILTVMVFSATSFSAFLIIAEESQQELIKAQVEKTGKYQVSIFRKSTTSGHGYLDEYGYLADSSSSTDRISFQTEIKPLLHKQNGCTRLLLTHPNASLTLNDTPNAQGIRKLTGTYDAQQDGHSDLKAEISINSLDRLISIIRGNLLYPESDSDSNHEFDQENKDFMGQLEFALPEATRVVTKSPQDEYEQLQSFTESVINGAKVFDRAFPDSELWWYQPLLNCGSENVSNENKPSSEMIFNSTWNGRQHIKGRYVDRLSFHFCRHERVSESSLPDYYQPVMFSITRRETRHYILSSEIKGEVHFDLESGRLVTVNLETKTYRVDEEKPRDCLFQVDHQNWLTSINSPKTLEFECALHDTEVANTPRRLFDRLSIAAEVSNNSEIQPVSYEAPPNEDDHKNPEISHRIVQIRLIPSIERETE